MGSGIAELALASGHPVVLCDCSGAALEAAREAVFHGLARRTGKVPAPVWDAGAVIRRLIPTARLADLAACDLVVEAVVEDIGTKMRVLRGLERYCRAGTVLATNTSSLPVGRLSECLERPGRFAGLHFFNPVSAMQLVEVVSAPATRESTVRWLHERVLGWGRQPVHVADSPGFIVNRVARPFYCEPQRQAERGAASIGQIDAVFRYCGGFRMGPFELMDLIGNDVNLAVTRSLYEAFGNAPRFRPGALQASMVQAGNLGRKSGRGWYDYANARRDEPAGRRSRYRPRRIGVPDDLGMAQELVDRARGAGIEVARAPGEDAIRLDGFSLALTDGRSARQRRSDTGEDFVLFDLCADYAGGSHIAIAADPSADAALLDRTAGFFDALGMAAIVIGDTPGMCLMATVCMMVNEAADCIAQDVTDRAGVDLAMRLGANHPLGPIAWADRVGVNFIRNVLSNMQRENDPDRYRCSALLEAWADSPARRPEVFMKHPASG